MKRLAKAVVAVALLSLALGVCSVVQARRYDKNDGPTKPLPRIYEKVDKIDTEKFTLNVLSKDRKKTTTYGITQFTKIVVNGKSAKFDEIKEGMKVSVNSTDGKTATRIDADDMPAGAEEPGKEKK
jgi:hypothetical protein